VATGSAISAAPVSYSENEKQHIVVPVGAGSGMQFAYPSFHAGKKARGTTRLMSFSLDGKAVMPSTQYVERELPELPPLKAGPEAIERGHELFSSEGCSGCHGKSAVARAGGTVPDLRYTTQEVYQQWNGIVIGGARLAKGMPGFDLSAEDAQAIRAWVLSTAYELAAERSAAQQPD
jgi:quinohemoprotein ethanol dehydrogenase